MHKVLALTRMTKVLPLEPYKGPLKECLKVQSQAYFLTIARYDPTKTISVTISKDRAGPCCKPGRVLHPAFPY